MERFTLLVGTRPEIIKMYPIIVAAAKKGLLCELVHSGQHYDHSMSGVFIREFGIQAPRHYLNVGSGSQISQIGQILLRLEKLVRHQELRNLVVVGDTNTVLGGSLFASRLGLRLFHVEAGARCYDAAMPEEQNRVVADHLADYLFAPTTWNQRVLRDENVRGKAYVTGNTVIDVCVHALAQLASEPHPNSLSPFDEFALVTAHRQEIVDSRQNLSELIKILLGLPLPSVFPCHPRTMKGLRAFGLLQRVRDSRKVALLPPLGYTDFLALMKAASFIVSDSGGITEEATSPGLDKLVFSPRTVTELPEAIKSGHLVLVGVKHDKALRLIRRKLDIGIRTRGHPYGIGRAGETIGSHLKRIVEIG